MSAAVPSQEGRFADAKHEFTMALNALEETRFWNGLARAYEYIAEMHVQLENYDEAVALRRQTHRTRPPALRTSASRRRPGIRKPTRCERAGRTEEAAECRARAAELESAAAQPQGV